MVGLVFLGFTVAASAGCLVGNMAGNAGNWYTPITMTITNNCSTAQSLGGAQINFTSNGQPVSSVWGDYSASNFSQNGFTLVNSANKPALAVGGVANIQFGVNTSGTAFNISAANSSLTINGSSASSGGSSSGSSGGTTVPPSQVIETPTPSGCVTGSFSALSDAKNAWYTGATLKIVNSCGTAVNLDGAAVTFTSNAVNLDGPWYPFKGTQVSVKSGAAKFVLSSQNDTSKSLAAGASTNLTMGIYLNGQIFDLGNANATLKVVPVGAAAPTPDNGVITVTVNPAGVTGLASGTVGTITISSNALAQPIVISNSNWTSPSTYTYQGLTYATYTVAASNVGNYSGNATPVTLTLQNSTPAGVTVSYQAIPVQQKGSVTVVLPVKPISSLTDTGMTVNLIDKNTNQVESKLVSFNQSVTFANMPANDTYSVSLVPANLSDGVKTATPVFSANNFKLGANATQNVNVSFQVVNNPTSPVNFHVSGLTAATSKVNVVLTNLQGNRIGTVQFGNGLTTMQVPNNTYAIDVDATPLVATATPTSFTVPQATDVNITVGAAPVFTPQLGAYWAGWMGYQYDLSNTYGGIPLTNIFLSFANYSNGKIDTSVSGWFGDVPAANAQIQPTYQNWTTYAYNHPNVKMMLSLGGASFSAMWSNLNSDQAAQNMANAIIKMLSTQYPVYAPANTGNVQSAFAVNGAVGSAGAQYGNSHLLGYVQMGGVDFDVEVSGAQQMAAMTPYLVKVVNAVHSALPNKAITFATFSVAADPANACTVPGSAHCGEALPLINAINAAGLKNYVTYNVMAYDAGTDFVLPTSVNGGVPLYQKAMQNYVNAVGDSSKVVLGLDLQAQWGVASPLTCAQLASEAQWAYQHPSLAGGTFLWEIGDDSNACKALPALQGMAAAMPK